MQAIPIALEMRDLIGIAETGSGAVHVECTVGIVGIAAVVRTVGVVGTVAIVAISGMSCL